MGKLQGKVAVVTGASKGIGAGIAKAWRPKAPRSSSTMPPAARAPTISSPRLRRRAARPIAVGGDVAKAADVKALLAETKKAFGKLDVLVNNAGVYDFFPLEQFSEAQFHRQFNINVLGPTLMAQEALKLFGNEGGSIINVSSVAAYNSPANSLVYSATKAALDTVTRVLAQELAPRKIRVNSLNPGGVETEGTHSMSASSAATSRRI